MTLHYYCVGIRIITSARVYTYIYIYIVYTTRHGHDGRTIEQMDYTCSSLAWRLWPDTRPNARTNILVPGKTYNRNRALKKKMCERWQAAEESSVESTTSSFPSASVKLVCYYIVVMRTGARQSVRCHSTGLITLISALAVVGVFSAWNKKIK